MPVVTMPDGANVQFPDDMPAAQIKALILSKFPDAASAARPGTPQYAAQFSARQAAGQPQPQPASPPPEWQPPDVMPAPLRAFSTHAVESVPIAGPLIHNAAGTDPMFQAVNQSADRQAPAAAIAGDVFGTVAPLAAAGATGIGARALGMSGGLGARVGMGALSSGTIGGADALARGQSPQDAMGTAAIDAGVGAALPFAGAAVRKIFQKPAQSVTLDSLQAAKNNAYDAVKQTGAVYSPTAVDNLVSDITQKAQDFSLSPKRHEAAWSILQELQNRPQGSYATLTQLDQLRQVIRRDLVTPGLRSPDMAADGEFGRKMVDSIDNFISNAQPSDMLAANPAVAASKIAAARAANVTYRKVETLDDLVYAAQLKSAASGSGGNINNSLRQGVKSILLSPQKAAQFTPSERKVMEGIVNGGPLENTARVVGKLSPVGNGLSAMFGIGATAANPMLGLAPVAGMVAKNYADNATLRKIMGLRNIIAGGAKAAAAGRSAVAPAVPALATGRVAPPQLPQAIGQGTMGWALPALQAVPQP